MPQYWDNKNRELDWAEIDDIGRVIEKTRRHAYMAPTQDVDQLLEVADALFREVKRLKPAATAS